MDECAAKRSAVPRGLGGSDGRGVRPRRRPRCPDRGARLGASNTRTRASHCRPGGDRCWFRKTTVGVGRCPVVENVDGSRIAFGKILSNMLLLRFSGARVAALPSARHTPAATMAEQGKQDIVRKLIHIFLDVPHDIFVNFTRSIERGTRHRNAHEKNPTPNPRALFPFGTRDPIPGSHPRRPSSAGRPLRLTRSPRRSRRPMSFVSFARKRRGPPPQPPARLRSSSGSASSASCSWSPSCTKRRRS